MAVKRTKAVLAQFFATGKIPVGANFEDLIYSMSDDLAPQTYEIVSGAITVESGRPSVFDRQGKITQGSPQPVLRHRQTQHRARSGIRTP